MREIKFRAKTLKEGKWVYGFYAHFIDSFRGRETHRIFSGMADSDPEDFFPDFEAVDPATVGQFTGIRDINGIDIYEGDIVRYRWTDERYKKNPRYCIVAINYRNNSARFQAGDIYHEDLWAPKLEVIGNIYDNPELLDEKTRS